MDILTMLKYGADIGLTMPTMAGLYIVFQINKKFNNFDVRLSVLESHKRRCSDSKKS